MNTYVYHTYRVPTYQSSSLDDGERAGPFDKITINNNNIKRRALRNNEPINKVVYKRYCYTFRLYANERTFLTRVKNEIYFKKIIQLVPFNIVIIIYFQYDFR